MSKMSPVSVDFGVIRVTWTASTVSSTDDKLSSIWSLVCAWIVSIHHVHGRSPFHFVHVPHTSSEMTQLLTALTVIILSSVQHLGGSVACAANAATSPGSIDVTPAGTYVLTLHSAVNRRETLMTHLARQDSNGRCLKHPRSHQSHHISHPRWKTPRVKWWMATNLTHMKHWSDQDLIDLGVAPRYCY